MAIDTEKMKQEFVQARMRFNSELLLNQSGRVTRKNFFTNETFVENLPGGPARLKEKPMSEDVEFVTILTNEGRTAYVIEAEAFQRLQKSVVAKMVKE